MNLIVIGSFQSYWRQIFTSILLVSLILTPIASAAENSLNIADNDLKVQIIAKNLNKPSGFEFMGKDILIIQKDDGKVRIIRDHQLKEHPVLDVNVYNVESDAGLLGITAAPTGNTTSVFLFYTENPSQDGGSKATYGLGNRVYRYEWNSTGLKLTNPKLILDLPSAPYLLDTGGKIVIGPDGYLYTIIGDLLREGSYQNMPDKDPAKNRRYDNKTETSGILRTTIDGQAAEDNPFHKAGFEKYFAFGIRNSFGIAFDPLNGNLWDTERGPAISDELNLVKPGFNSGWKQIQGKSIDTCCISDYYYASKLSQDVNNLYKVPGSYYSDPKFVWREGPAVTALTFVPTTILGDNYFGTLFVGDLQGSIYKFELDADRQAITNNSNYTWGSGFGMISDMKIGPDDALYVLAFSDHVHWPMEPNSGVLYRISKDNIIVQSSSALDYYMILSIFIIIIVIVILATKLYNRVPTRLRFTIRNKNM